MKKDVSPVRPSTKSIGHIRRQRPAKKDICVVSYDVTLADKMIPIHTDGEAEQLLMEAFGPANIKPGGKVYIESKEEFDRLTALLEADGRLGKAPTSPGGSSSNVLRTLQRLGGVETHMITMVGDDENGKLIKKGFHDAHTKLHEITAPGVTPENGVSYIFTYPNGSRFTAVYTGNAKDILTHERMPHEVVKKADVLLIQGAARKKFDKRRPHDLQQRTEGEYAMDRILTDRFWTDGEGSTYRKDAPALIVTYPTTSFGASYFDWISRSADVICTNADELCHVFVPSIEHADPKKRVYTPAEKDLALEKLRMDLVKGAPALAKIGHKPGIAFVTDDVNDSYVVTTEGVIRVPTIPAEKVVQTLGAGDTAATGFIKAYLSGVLTPEEMGQFAGHLATAKLAYNNSVIPHPHEAMLEGKPEATRLMQKIDTAPTSRPWLITQRAQSRASKSSPGDRDSDRLGTGKF